MFEGIKWGIKELFGINQKEREQRGKDKITKLGLEGELSFEVSILRTLYDSWDTELPEDFQDSESEIIRCMSKLNINTYPFDLTSNIVLSSINNIKTLTIEKEDYEE